MCSLSPPPSLQDMQTVGHFDGDDYGDNDGDDDGDDDDKAVMMKIRRW